MAHKTANPIPFDPSIFTVIRAEDLEAIGRIKADLIAHYQPANSEELFALERIALARHSLLRVYRMESGVVTFGIQKALQIPGDPRILQDPEEPGETPVTRGQKASFWMAAGFYEATKMGIWQFFLRYQAQTERLYRHAVEDFERLRRQRGPAPGQNVPEPVAARPATQKSERPGPPKRQIVNRPAGSVSSRRHRTMPTVVLVPHCRRPTRASFVAPGTEWPGATRSAADSTAPAGP